MILEIWNLLIEENNFKGGYIFVCSAALVNLMDV